MTDPQRDSIPHSFTRTLINVLLISGGLQLATFIHVPVARAWFPTTHWTMTDSLLKHLGWKRQAAIDKVVDCNIATDLIASDFSFFFPHASGEKDSVQALANTFPPNTKGTNGFHFDDLFSYDDIKKRMQDMDSWMNQQIALLVAAGWGEGQDEKFLRILGMILHAIQDFYCHSNWVNQLNPYTAGKNFNPDDFPTWDELTADLGGWKESHPGFPAKGALERLEMSNGNPSEKEKDGKGNPQGGLQTGAWDKPKIKDPKNPKKDIKPWHHRHPGGKEGAAAIALGARASRQWIAKAFAQLPQACRDQMTAYVTATDSLPSAVDQDPIKKDHFYRGVKAVWGPIPFFSRLNVVTPGGGPAAAFMDSTGAMAEFQPEDYEYSDFDVAVTEAAAESISVSSDPETRALLEQAAGNLVVTRGGAGSGALAQSTFIDGRQGGTACGSPPCWPGLRGDAGPHGVHDNVNSAIGDSILFQATSELRPDGMGINWRIGYDAQTGALDKVNSGFVPTFGPPRMIFRLWDPATKTWSPFDSTEMIADRVAIVGGDTLVLGGILRTDWPPRDKLPSGTLPGGFSINGVTQYSALTFLPHGAKLQYTFRNVEIDGTAMYGYRISESESPASSPHTAFFDDEGDAYADATLNELGEPGLLTFSVLPGVYQSGSGGTLLAGRTNTPLLLVDANYLDYGVGADPSIVALRGMGVRADVFRLEDAGLHRGNGIGGHELTGVTPAHSTNFFPNSEDWALGDSLARWYRLIVLDTGDQLEPVVEDADAQVLTNWWNRPTGTDAGDRGLFGSGDNLARNLISPPGGASANQLSLASNGFGVGTAAESWAGSTASPYPVIDDRFAAPSSGPGLAPPSSYTYPIDGGSGNLSIADGLTATASAQLAASFPSDGAATSRIAELDIIPDHDRSKSVLYSFGSEYTRTPGIPPSSSEFLHSGINVRMQLIFKFLTGCRAARSTADTAACWPCSTPSTVGGNWASLAEFQTTVYGPLYAIQDPLLATGILEQGSESAPLANTVLQNQPNPFNPRTRIRYHLAGPGHVRMRVYDPTGRLVGAILDADEPSGWHEVSWNGAGRAGTRLASGVYFYRIEYPDGSSDEHKMVMLR